MRHLMTEKPQRPPQRQPSATVNLQRLAVRSFSVTPRQMRNKVPEYQKFFQADNGLPVHIKGGTTDVILYRITMGITLAGTCFSLYWLLVACQPRNK